MTGFGGQLGDLPLPRAYNSIASWPLCELFPCCLTSLLRNKRPARRSGHPRPGPL